MFGSKPFGSTTTNSTFGSSGSSLFGQKPAGSSLFGATAPANQGTSSLWGAQKPATTSLFGNSPSQSSSLFGGTTQNTSGSSLFGSTQAKPSLFGSSQPVTSTFGSPSSQSSLFGGMGTTSGGSLFGSSTAATTNGTTVKFQAQTGTDTMLKNNTQQNINTKHMCISAMKEYETKSLEELRMEDYLAGRKGPTAGSATASLFGGVGGATTSSTSMFGASTQPKTGIFGSPTSNSFGAKPATTNTLFGTQPQQQASSSIFGPKPATGGLFNSTTTSAFGGTTASPGTSSIFGGTQPQASTFGQPATGGSLFGGPTAATSAFGTTNTAQPSTGFTFGGSNTGTSAFGQAPSTNLFGGQTATANTGNSLFQKQPGGNFGFGGGTTTNAFGAQPAASGGLFGPPAANKSLFGSTTAPGLFGQTQPQQPQAGGLFGPQAQPTIAAAMPSQVPVAAAAPIVLGSDVNQRQIERALLEAQLAATPYGDGPLLKWMAAAKETTDDQTNSANVQRQLKFLESLAGSPVLSGNGSLVPPSLPRPGSSLGKSPIVQKDLSYAAASRVPTLANGIRTVPAMSNSPLSARRNGATPRFDAGDATIDSALLGSTNQLISTTRRTNIKHLDPMMMRDASTVNSPKGFADPDELPKITNRDKVVSTDNSTFVVKEDARKPHNPVLPSLHLDGSLQDDSIVQVQPAAPQMKIQETSAPKMVSKPTDDVITSPKSISSNDDYFSDPPLDRLKNQIDDDYIDLPDGLLVGRLTYGSVFWPGPLRISKDININKVVVFRNKEVTVYPNEDQKPSVGEELNRCAEVTLERVWPVEKETKQLIKDPEVLIGMKWRERLERISARMGANFKDYRPTTGSWVFRVDHFSSYGLLESEETKE
ncbi:unnamed protein product, partial [Mesorhabditis belari]|uniref:Nuclear pore complex protein Nup98-Nup96 n=1 Tax=Mesorhabditis belari TaxID=2138241 RepID=A0AAF3FHB9_9BILA